MRLSTATIAVSAILASMSLQADAYITGGFSSTTLDPTISPGPSTTSHDSDDSSFYFDIGYFVTERVAIEFGYRSAESKEQYNYADTLAGDTEATVYKLGAKAFTSRDAGLYGFGGAGLAMYEQEIKVTDGTPTSPTGTQLKADTNNVYYSVGAGYRFDNEMSVELGYADYGDVSDAANTSNPAKTSFTEITIGLSIPF